jgi:hypothetical protein
MSEAKNQVWVIHDEDGEPINADAYAADAVEFRPPRAVRYVPEASAQGEAGRTVTVEKVEAFATLLRQAAFMASQAGHADASRVYLDCERELKDSLLPPPPKGSP